MKYEYKVVPLTTGEPEYIQEVMDYHSEGGWKLHTVLQALNWPDTAIFEREVKP